MRLTKARQILPLIILLAISVPLILAPVQTHAQQDSPSGNDNPPEGDSDYDSGDETTCDGGGSGMGGCDSGGPSPEEIAEAVAHYQTGAKAAFEELLREAQMPNGSAYSTPGTFEYKAQQVGERAESNARQNNSGGKPD